MIPHYPGQVPIDCYGGGGFGFAGMSHRGSVLALPSGIYGWSVEASGLQPSDFAPVLSEAGRIDLLIIGMGPGMARPPQAVRAALAVSGIVYDAMATGHAVATYNLLLAEKRRVAAALIAMHHPA
ncbi:Mth938-like domain-containing protein [Aestuariivirga sp.]|uniref:Mth938-like domain-containing protein n=1 Tax=Aestuariivirga sp. TaxID=2650926 RepID=UPI003784FADD